MQSAMGMAVNMATTTITPPPTHTTFAKSFASPSSHVTSLSIRRGSMRIQSQPTNQEYVNYAGKESVFPAEACEEVGGDSCNIDGVGPEVKPKAKEPKETPKNADGPNRVYVNYAGSKTVLPGEACDDLGGEFCEGEYQDGVYPENGKPSS